MAVLAVVHRNASLRSSLKRGITDPYFRLVTCRFAVVAGILKYASSSHLASSTRRIAGVKPADLARLGPRGVLIGFLKGRTRSRL
ncbi:MAG: hypothetical protein O7D29_10070 [Gemmatimonadetes bacterium]|nr:hypothetical protein [Gemmatimonadota bacterium]